MDLNGVLLLAFFGLLDLTPGMSIGVKEESFRDGLLVNNKTVSCAQVDMTGTYRNQMYTCVDIRVDGWHVFHGNNDYQPSKNSNIYNNNGCPECPCGINRNEPSDMLALCSAMLQSQGISGQLVAAYTPRPICVQTQKERRIKFYKVDGQEKWLHLEAHNGYLSKLQCMLDYKNSKL